MQSFQITNMSRQKALDKDPTVRWTPQMEEQLFESLVGQCQIGKRAESGFKKEAWTAVVNAINGLPGQTSNVNQLQCKNKMEAYKMKYKEWIGLSN